MNLYASTRGACVCVQVRAVVRTLFPAFVVACLSARHMCVHVDGLAHVSGCESFSNLCGWVVVDVCVCVCVCASVGSTVFFFVSLFCFADGWPQLLSSHVCVCVFLVCVFRFCFCGPNHFEKACVNVFG